MSFLELALLLSKMEDGINSIFTDSVIPTSITTVMVSQASVILSTIGLMATWSLLMLVKAWLLCVLLECFLVNVRFSKTILSFILLS